MPDRYATRTIVAGGETALMRCAGDGPWADIATFTKQADAERAARLLNHSEAG
jgi:hypothetical protein